MAEERLDPPLRVSAGELRVCARRRGPLRGAVPSGGAGGAGGERQLSLWLDRRGSLRAAGSRLAVPVVGELVGEAKAIPRLPGNAEHVRVVVGVDRG